MNNKLLYKIIIQALENEEEELKQILKFFKGDYLTEVTTKARIKELKEVKKILNEVFKNYG